MVLISWSAITIIIAELTAPWEERLVSSHQLKKAKYQDLVDEAVLKGWHATSYPIEVGCRGFPAKSVNYFLQRVRMGPNQAEESHQGHCRSSGIQLKMAVAEKSPQLEPFCW